MSESLQRLRVSTDDSIATVVLNRPEKRNALDRLMVDELTMVFDRLSQDESLKGIVITGEGKAFCAGADLAYLVKLSEFDLQENQDDSRALADMFLSIWNCPVTVVGKIQGHALAGGCGLATVCDISVAVDGAKFGYTEVGIGFVPAIVMAFLLRKSTMVQVQELLLTGTIIDAKEAAERGLITRMVGDAEELERDIVDVCANIRRSDRAAVVQTKKMLRTIQDMPLEGAVDYATLVNASARMMPGCKAGMKAFLEKSAKS